MPLLTTYIRGRRITVGELTEEKMFKKNALKSKHMFHKIPSWAFDYDIFVNAILPQATMIVIHEKEEDKYYATIPSVFGKIVDGKFISSDKVFIRRYNRNGENGTQIFLPIRYWWQSGEPFMKEDIDREIERTRAQSAKQGRLI